MATTQTRSSPQRAATQRNGGRAIGRASILEAALAIIDKEGLKALTMRHLGRSLGIEAMSIYHYFSSRDELLDGIVEAIMLEVGRVSQAAKTPGEDWKAVARRLNYASRTVGKRHVEAYQLFARRPLRTVSAIEQGRELVDAFANAGLSPSTAVVAYRSISCFTAGFVLLETSMGTPAFSAGGFDNEFAAGLDVILAGVEATLLPAKFQPKHRKARPARSRSRSARK